MMDKVQKLSNSEQIISLNIWYRFNVIVQKLFLSFIPHTT
jgi:hypothetical protein